MDQKKPKTVKEFTVKTTSQDGKESEKTYLLVEPTAKQVRDSRWHYSIIFSQALRDGLMTERQMSEILHKKDQEVSDNESGQLASLYIQAVAMERRLNDTESLKEKQKVADELRSLRLKIS